MSGSLNAVYNCIYIYIYILEDPQLERLLLFIVPYRPFASSQTKVHHTICACVTRRKLLMTPRGEIVYVMFGLNGGASNQPPTGANG